LEGTTVTGLDFGNVRQPAVGSLVAGLLVATVACGGGSTTPSGGGVVHLFSIQNLTGTAQSYAVPVQNSEQLFVDNLNSKGGFKDKCGNSYTLSLSSFDMADSKEQAITGMRQAASDSKNLVVLGPLADVGNVPLVPVAGQLQMPYIIPSFGTTIPTWNKYSFRVLSDDTAIVGALLQKLQATIGIKSVGIIYSEVDTFQTNEYSVLKTYFGSNNITYTAVGIKPGGVSYKSELTSLKAKNPDWLFVLAAVPEGIKIINDSHDLGGIGNHVYVSAGSSLIPDMYNGTHGLLKGTYTVSPVAIGPGITANVPEAIDMYTSKYGAPPIYVGPLGWDAAAVSVDAVKRACTGTDRAKFVDALANTTKFPMVEGGYITWKNPPSGDSTGFSVVVEQVTGPGTFQAV
jgi:branched-chain amino acid transport system substrate-binding protein